MGILRDKIIEAMKRYENRRPDVIYAHMLDDTVWNALRERRKITSEMIVGEIVHQGAERILDEPEPKCRKLYIRVDGIVKEAYERFVKLDEHGFYVEVCGSADGLIDGIPVELKTTRSPNKLRKPPKHWVRRSRIYAWLYNTGKAYLIVFNLITGDEHDHAVPQYTDEEMREIVEKWLRGEFPSTTLPVFRNSNKDKAKTESSQELP